MKTVFLLLVLLLVPAVSLAQGNSNSVDLLGVAPPTDPVITSISPTQVYTDQGVTVLINGSGFVAADTVNYNGAIVPSTFVSATQLKIVIAVGGVKLGKNPIFVVPPPRPVLTLTTPVTLPNAQVGKTYSASLPAFLKPQGGTAPYSYSLSAGTLPTGLTLSASGTVNGTPSGAGSKNFTILVTDSTQSSQTLTGEIIVAQNSSIKPTVNAVSGR